MSFRVFMILVQQLVLNGRYNLLDSENYQKIYDDANNYFITHFTSLKKQFKVYDLADFKDFDDFLCMYINMAY